MEQTAKVISIIPRQRNWREQANCKDIDPALADEMWQPEDMRSACAKLAKRICNDCVVKDNCLLDAIVTGESLAIRGGMSPSERKAYAKERADADEPA